ncbi:YIP1 family protein [Halalkalibacterium halodurans]|jgi:hypothetical protein|nr:YIP1 family protein [Halalkalibacterium halodurans]TPE69935.1 YIP1 family protein [Halalkalibacterium halodurans]
MSGCLNKDLWGDQMSVNNEVMEHENGAGGEKPSIIGIFTSPLVQLERIKQNPKVLVPLLIFMAIGLVSSLLVAFGLNMTDLATPEELAMMPEGFEVFVRMTVVMGGIFTILLVPLISAAVQLLIAKLAAKDVTFKQLFSMNLFVGFISLAGGLLNSVIAFLFGLSLLSTFTSLGTFVEMDHALFPLLNTIEIFTIWGFVILAFGLQKVAGFGKLASWVIVTIFFVIMILLSLTGTGV